MSEKKEKYGKFMLKLGGGKLTSCLVAHEAKRVKELWCEIPDSNKTKETLCEVLDEVAQIVLNREKTELIHWVDQMDEVDDKFISNQVGKKPALESELQSCAVAEWVQLQRFYCLQELRKGDKWRSYADSNH